MPEVRRNLSVLDNPVAPGDAGNPRLTGLDASLSLNDAEKWRWSATLAQPNVASTIPELRVRPGVLLGVESPLL